MGRRRILRKSPYPTVGRLVRGRKKSLQRYSTINIVDSRYIIAPGWAAQLVQAPALGSHPGGWLVSNVASSAVLSASERRPGACEYPKVPIVFSKQSDLKGQKRIPVTVPFGQQLSSVPETCSSREGLVEMRSRLSFVTSEVPTCPRNRLAGPVPYLKQQLLRGFLYSLVGTVLRQRLGNEQFITAVFYAGAVAAQRTA